MKKNMIYIILLIIVLALTILGILFFKNRENEEEKNYISYINVSDLKKKIDNKDDFVLVLTQDGCSHCESYYPVINSVIKKYDIKIYDVNLTSLSTKEINELNKIASINGTPTTLFFINGEEKTTLNRINGQTTEDNLVKKLKNLGFIKE